MAIDSKKILVGAPNQSNTTGAVNYAPVGTVAPDNATDDLDGFTSCGYVSEDGLVITPNYSTVDIKDWSRNTVRTLLEEFTGEVTFTFIQTDYDSLVAIFGAEHVSRTLASDSHGEQITISMGAHMAPAKCFVFNMKDNDARVRVVLPNAQPILDGDLTFVANQPINWGVKLSCGADEDGESIYIHTDDGVTTATTTTTTGA